ncbi:MAG: DUF2306 domain-containing protein [Acidimicrobiia bacterium]|nr:DUF2306 domain-containing protein [Acidimicrobiia bacterium]
MKQARTVKFAAWVGIVILIVAVLVFAAIRFLTDIPNVLGGSLPPEGDFARRYARYPMLAYSHILPGLVFLVAAPFQISRRFRTRHLRMHRKLGKALLFVGALTGISAIAVGVVMPFGGLVETSATIVFGMYFLLALRLGYRAVRRFDLQAHRHWMVRAFALAIGVGTIRAWGGIFEAFGIPLADSFGLSFWLAFVLHAIAAEVWLWWRPDAPPLGI